MISLESRESRNHAHPMHLLCTLMHLCRYLPRTHNHHDHYNLPIFVGLLDHRYARRAFPARWYRDSKAVWVATDNNKEINRILRSLFFSSYVTIRLALP